MAVSRQSIRASAQLLFAIAVLGVAACSSSSGSSLDQACSAYANIVRSRETTCYGVAPEHDESAIVSRAVKSCVLASGAAGSMVGADYWSACASAANDNCGGYKCPTYPAGSRQTGEPCLASTQCASLWCRGTVITDSNGSSALAQALQCGACAPRLPERSPCNVAVDACDVGMSCFQGACRVQGQAGAPCVFWSDCAFPSVCRAGGICGGVLGRGQACITSRDCTTDEGCDPVTRVCASIQFGQPGAACDGEVRLCESGRCDSTSGTCPAVLADGTPCDPSNPSAVCEVYSYCFGGACQIPDPHTCH